MKTSSRQEWERLVERYYGTPPRGRRGAARAQAQSTATSAVITRAFDNGAAQPMPGGTDAGEYIEYDMVSRAASQAAAGHSSEFVEYEVLRAPDAPPAYAAPAGAEGFEEVYVEPFGTVDVPEGGLPLPEPAASNAPAAVRHATSGRTANSGSAGKPAMETVGEEDFLADIKSILSGAKQYNPEAKALTDAQSGGVAQLKEEARKHPQPVPESQAPAAAPPLKESEHAIFDRIAQSMQYANAYDLGTMPLEQRFDNFDAAPAPRPAISMQTAAVHPHVSYPAQAPTVAVAAMAVPVVDVPTPSEFIQDMDLIAARAPEQAFMASVTAARTLPLPIAFTEDIALDPGVGGRSVGQSALNPGDLIISTTPDLVSHAIRLGTGSEVSHALVYLGEGQIIEAIGSGVVERALADALSASNLAVAYRHVGMTPELAMRMAAFLRSKKGAGYNFGGLVRVAPSQLLATLCAKGPAALRDRCMAALPHFRPGTDANNEFFCSQLLFEGLQHVGLSISDAVPHVSPPQEIVRLAHNGTLSYVGHLKA